MDYSTHGERGIGWLNIITRCQQKMRWRKMIYVNGATIIGNGNSEIY